MTVGLSGSALRVVRGGSWNNPSGNLHAAIRNRNQARNRNRNLGFRVVCRFGPEHASPQAMTTREPCRRGPGQAGLGRPSETAQPGRSSKPHGPPSGRASLYLEGPW